MTSMRRGHIGAGTSLGLLAAVVAACGLGLAPSPTSVATADPRPVATPPPTRAASVDPTLRPIQPTTVVLGPNEAPPGMSHDETVTGPETLTLAIASGRDAEFSALDGFLDGRATFFSGDAGALMTAALAFENTVSADLASHSYQNELTSADGYGFTDTVRNTVAFESLCGTGPHLTFKDLTESICIWHTGPITFLVGGPIPMDDIVEIADELAARAEP